MSVDSQTSEECSLSYSPDQDKLELVQSTQKIEHLTVSGRIAFACPWNDQETICDAVKKLTVGQILNDLVELPTPGKVTVKVLILLDPYGYEICFVSDEGFMELSELDPGTEKALDEAIATEKSNEWAKKLGKCRAEP